MRYVFQHAVMHTLTSSMPGRIVIGCVMHVPIATSLETEDSRIGHYLSVKAQMWLLHGIPVLFNNCTVQATLTTAVATCPSHTATYWACDQTSSTLCHWALP